jgi:YVTN family beta-propeller protein
MMADFDELLTGALRDLAAEAPVLPPLSSRVRRRIRVARAAMVAAGVAVAAGLSTGLVIGAQALTRTAPQAGAHPVTAYVANFLSGTVTPIQTASNTALKPIHLASSLGEGSLAITPDGKTVYVANVRAGTVTGIQTATNTALSPIKTGPNADRLAITPDGMTLYVMNIASRPERGDRDPDRYQYGRQDDPGRGPTRRHRDHPGRQDRLRRRH